MQLLLRRLLLIASVRKEDGGEVEDVIGASGGRRMLEMSRSSSEIPKQRRGGKGYLVGID